VGYDDLARDIPLTEPEEALLRALVTAAPVSPAPWPRGCRGCRCR